MKVVEDGGGRNACRRVRGELIVILMKNEFVAILILGWFLCIKMGFVVIQFDIHTDNLLNQVQKLLVIIILTFADKCG